MSNDLEERIKKILAENEDLRNRTEAAKEADKKNQELEEYTDDKGKTGKRPSVKISESDPEVQKFRKEIRDRELIKEYKKQKEAAKVARARASLPRKEDPFRKFDYTPKKVIDLTEPEKDDRSTARKAAEAVSSGVGAVAGGITSRIGSGFSALYSAVAGAKDAEAEALEKAKKAEAERLRHEAEERKIAEKLRKTKADAAERKRLEQELRDQEAAKLKAQREAEAAERAAEQARRDKEAKKRTAERAEAEEKRKQQALVEEQRRKAAAEEVERKRKADEAERKRMMEERAELAKKAAAAQSAQTSSVNPNVKKLIALYGEESEFADASGTIAYGNWPLLTLQKLSEGSNDVEAAEKVLAAANGKSRKDGGLNTPEMRAFLYGISKRNRAFVTTFNYGAVVNSDGSPVKDDSLEKKHKSGVSSKKPAILARIKELVAAASRGERIKEPVDPKGPTPVRPVAGREEPNLSEIPQKTKPAPTDAPKKSKKKSAFAKRYDEIKDQKGNYRKLQTLAKDMGVGGKGKATEIKKRIEEGIRRGKLMDAGIDLDYSLSCHRDKKKKEVMLSGYDSEGDELIKPTAMICPSLGLADRKLMELIV